MTNSLNWKQYTLETDVYGSAICKKPCKGRNSHKAIIHICI